MCISFIRYQRGFQDYYFIVKIIRRCLLLQIPDFFYKDYMICNKANNDIDWRTLEDSLTIHKILWI